jgi:hypothetical protein
MTHHPRFRFRFGSEDLPAPGGRSQAGFLAYPGVLWQGLTPEQQLYQRQLYLLAWEQVQARLRPSLPERDLLAVWN